MRARIAGMWIVASLLTVPVTAAAAPKSEIVNLDRTVLVGGAVLSAGTYRLDVTPEGTARFTQKQKTIAEAPCKLGLAEVIYPGTAVHYRAEPDGRERLVKVVFASSKIAVEFPQEVAVAGSPAAPVADGH